MQENAWKSGRNSQLWSCKSSSHSIFYLTQRLGVISFITNKKSFVFAQLVHSHLSSLSPSLPSFCPSLLHSLSFNYTHSIPSLHSPFPLPPSSTSSRPHFHPFLPPPFTSFNTLSPSLLSSTVTHTLLLNTTTICSSPSTVHTHN